MKIIAIIPVRMASSRFPGKPLAKLLGMTMVEHVYRRCKLCKKVDEVYVATPDYNIAKEVKNFGGKPIMTSPLHKRACDRVAEASLTVEADVVVTIQGDEPLITPQMIDMAIEALVTDQEVVCVNLAAVATKEEANEPNEVKVVTDSKGNALYFSRAVIPTNIREEGTSSILKQICIIPMRKDFLQKFINLSPTPLEISESIDMLRLLEHGYKIKIIKTEKKVKSVDTMEDLVTAEKLLLHDPTLKLYYNVRHEK
ncbi:3-deoxy-manno-octulosonate cytidylyltransferase [subsurface metagenome]